MALLSASTLSYEVLLVRVFAVEQFHHFAYMAIGVAMLGFGASGTVLALFGRVSRERAARWFTVTALLTPLSLIASAALTQRVPLDAAQLPWDAAQWPRLALFYLLLAFPFAVGSLAILLALRLETRRSGWIYGASFVGAGVGALTALLVLWIVLPARGLAVPPLAAALGAATAGYCEAGLKRVRATVVGAATLLIAVAAVLRPPWSVEVSVYKGLPQVEAFPDARRVAERTSPLGWVVAVEAAAFRHAPGLSLAYQGEFPRQTALFVDGETAGAFARWHSDSSGLRILEWLPSAAPYALGGRDSVLVVAAADGLEVWNALTHGAEHVVAAELNPLLVSLAGWQGTNGRVEWQIGDARSFVVRTGASFDLITLGVGRGLGSAAAGVYALGEDFLHTVEAYSTYIERLSEDGVLAITRWLTVPPREGVRSILTAVEALRRASAEPVGDRVILLRSWATTTLLVKPAGFNDRDVRRLLAWSEERRFDLDWYPGISESGSRFNLLDEPVLYRALSAAAAGRDSAMLFASEYPFNVGPVTDARPYPHHFLRAGSLGAVLGGGRGSFLPFAEWGYIALLATLAQGAALAALLILLPALFGAGSARRPGWPRLMAYFAAIGLAYLSAELAAIQQLTLLLGHPVYAVAAVLAAFLVFSGVGSAWSDGQPVGRGGQAALALTVILILCGAALLAIVHQLQPAPLLLRAVVACLLLAPLAFLMGLPFPLGLRRLVGDDSGSLAWAWAANGFASVIAAPLAALIALEAGSATLFWMSAAFYACAGLLHRGAAERPGA